MLWNLWLGWRWKGIHHLLNILRIQKYRIEKGAIILKLILITRSFRALFFKQYSGSFLYILEKYRSKGNWAMRRKILGYLTVPSDKISCLAMNTTIKGIMIQLSYAAWSKILPHFKTAAMRWWETVVRLFLVAKRLD